VIQGIVLAAGMGRRVGAPKALLSLDGQTFLSRAMDAFSGAGLDLVVVMNPRVSEAVAALGFRGRRVVNPDPDGANGMFGSVRLGVWEARALGASGALLLPVDLPLVTGEDVRAVLTRLGAGAEVVVATHGGRRGHPIGISRAVMDEITDAPSTATLRDIVRRDPARVVEVPVSEGAVTGVNTKEDLERVANRTFR
jgi:CTP:molybdopterin cytidylyltransferase MocA